MNERIKKLRKALDLTQQEFANRIGSVQNTITGYETGRRVPSNQVISLICREFNVNETWLRTGEGEMFIQKPRNALEALVEEYHLSHSAYILIEKFLTMKPEIQRGIADYVVKVAAAMAADDVPVAPSYTSTPESVAEAEALYEKSLGIAPSTESLASTTTEDTGATGKEKMA